MPIAAIKGGPRRLGRALGVAPARRAWGLVLGARSAEALRETAAELGGRHGTRAVAMAGDHGLGAPQGPGAR
ncbi:hypothetical protein ACWD04_29360 [Streptomyces sp. NPDC002911]